MTKRQKAAAFFIVLGSLLVAATIALNVGWVILHWRRALPMVVGIILFALIIAGFVVYTIFIVREIRRNEQHEGFINAVTHELKTPIASIKLYLETLQSREVDDAKRKQFYQVMMADADRLHYTVEQVLRAGIAGQRRKEGGALVSVDMNGLVSEAAEIARARHHLSEDQLRVVGADSNKESRDGRDASERRPEDGFKAQGPSTSLGMTNQDKESRDGAPGSRPQSALTWDQKQKDSASQTPTERRDVTAQTGDGFKGAAENGSEPEAAYVLGDADELLTAVLNLMDNAVKYSADKVEITARVESPHRDMILVTVADRGIGIPRNQLDLIFDRFYRVPERARALLAKTPLNLQGAAADVADAVVRRSARAKGTGLGLYIVREIAKKHGGRVWAESAGEGKGSTFVLELPRAN